MRLCSTAVWSKYLYLACIIPRFRHYTCIGWTITVDVCMHYSSFPALRWLYCCCRCLHALFLVSCSMFCTVTVDVCMHYYSFPASCICWLYCHSWCLHALFLVSRSMLVEVSQSMFDCIIPRFQLLYCHSRCLHALFLVSCYMLVVLSQSMFACVIPRFLFYVGCTVTVDVWLHYFSFPALVLSQSMFTCIVPPFLLYEGCTVTLSMFACCNSCFQILSSHTCLLFIALFSIFTFFKCFFPRNDTKPWLFHIIISGFTTFRFQTWPDLWTVRAHLFMILLMIWILSWL